MTITITITITNHASNNEKIQSKPDKLHTYIKTCAHATHIYTHAHEHSQTNIYSPASSRAPEKTLSGKHPRGDFHVYAPSTPPPIHADRLRSRVLA